MNNPWRSWSIDLHGLFKLERKERQKAQSLNEFIIEEDVVIKEIDRTNWEEKRETVGNHKGLYRDRCSLLISSLSSEDNVTYLFTFVCASLFWIVFKACFKIFVVFGECSVIRSSSIFKLIKELLSKGYLAFHSTSCPGLAYGYHEI